MEQVAQPVAASTEQHACPVHGVARTFQFVGPWFRTDEAAAYVQCRHRRCGCVSVNAFYQWQRTHGVVAHKGRILKADLDAALMPRTARRFKRSA